MVAGLTTLKKMKREEGWNVLKNKTEKFVSQLRAGFEKIGSDLQITSYGSLFWIHSKSISGVIRAIDQIPKNQAQDFKKIFLQSLNKGVYLAPNAYEVGFVSLAHSEALLQEAAEIILESLEK
jgi:glutamate-1-semialdehyde 2,1-aminomutase